MKPFPAAPSPLDVLASLYPAVVADVLDALGYRAQILNHRVRPLTPAAKVSGRVFTAKAQPVAAIPHDPYAREIAAIEALAKGDVLVIDAQDDTNCSLWGELLTTACMHKGARGVVMTTCTRDVWKIKDLAFPVFGIGDHPADSKGRTDVIAIDCPIEIGGVKTKTGDLIIGDEDGVVIIPSEVSPEVLSLASKKMSEENLVRAALEQGMPIGVAFRTFGVL